MKNVMRVISVLMVGLVWLTTSVEMASAQSIIRAVYRIKITDPATGAIFFADRESIRSWSSENACEREKNSFSGFHIKRLKGMNITNSDGAPLEIMMDSSYCVVIRE